VFIYTFFFLGNESFQVCSNSVNPGEVKIVPGAKNFIAYLFFAITFAILLGLLIDLVM